MISLIRMIVADKNGGNQTRKARTCMTDAERVDKEKGSIDHEIAD
jgi:hypothetical protein